MRCPTPLSRPETRESSQVLGAEVGLGSGCRCRSLSSASSEQAVTGWRRIVFCGMGETVMRVTFSRLYDMDLGASSECTPELLPV